MEKSKTTITKEEIENLGWLHDDCEPDNCDGGF